MLTGGNGMVGRNIRQHPDAGRWDILAPSSAELDLTDFAATSRFFKTERPEVVIHAAGRVGGIQANIANPVDFLVTNADLGRNVILAARQAGVTKLLNLASSCIYPREAVNPLREDLILKGELEPTNEGYALAKIFALRLCQYINKEDGGVRYKTFVPCNLYGRYDNFSPEHSHLISAIIHKVELARTGGSETVEIWGDGTARREFMYAGDLADAVFKAISDFDAVPDILNVGVGFDYSINEYYEAVARVVGWQGRFVHDMTRPVGMKQKLVDVERQKHWGWAPPTALDDGIRSAYHYYMGEAGK
ncbi:MAG: GDP-L-fucose synthase [Alphaproteobacteria bacterium]|nr:GDP-L-fucose synthase [Alphaproteobacteria bacterium]